jgi:hypothetical protein
VTSEELKRLQALEQLMRALMRDVDALREQVGAPRGEYATTVSAAAAPPVKEPADLPRSESRPAPASDVSGEDARVPAHAAGPPFAFRAGVAQSTASDAPAVAPAAAQSSWSLEEIVGRYGTVALGATVILAGVGVLLSWAVAQGMFGPRVRLLLAALLAGGFAIAGMRIRARGSVRFGSILLALSLALTHVVAWGAGPALEVVPNIIALGLAVAASLALARFALSNREETLCSVGVGGALLAPFVTMEGDGALPLLIYGAIIVLGALWSLRSATWRIAPAMLALGAIAYTATATAAEHGTTGEWIQVAPFMFALVLAWGTLLLGAPRALTFTFLGAALVAGHPWTFPAAGALQPVHAFAALAALALLTGYLAVRARPGGAWAGFWALSLPLMSIVVALTYVPWRSGSMKVVVPLLWGALAALMVQQDGERREVHSLVASSAGVAALLMVTDGLPLALALVGFSVLVLGTARKLQLRLPALPALLALFAVYLFALQSLDTSVAFGTPFRTSHSIAAGAAVLALLVIARICRQTAALERACLIAAALAAFFWLHFELAIAFSANTATFLLIIYYAVVGVLALTVGRMRGIAYARHAGLLLALFAGLKALWEASDLEPIGMRFGAFMVVGIFLLGVAYRYWPRTAAMPQAEPLVPEAK